MKHEKKSARHIQTYTGARYSTCLRWVRILREEKLITNDTSDKDLRIALHKRFPDVEVALDGEQ